MLPLLNEIKGQPSAVEALNRLGQGVKIPPGLLFLGPPHVGKATAACAFFAALNCRTAPGSGCAACASCAMWHQAEHPDHIVLAAEGQGVKIGQMRWLNEQLGMKPLGGQWRMVLVPEAEKFTLESTNALLKHLEEPPPHTFFVLCCPSKQLLASTLVSRCVPLCFSPLKDAAIETLLGQPLPPLARDFALRFARGSQEPDLAKALPEWLALRATIVDTLTPPTPQAFRKLKPHLAYLARPPHLPFVLRWMKTWFRDLALATALPETAWVNADLAPALGVWQKFYPAKQAAFCYDHILAAEESLALNVNKPLLLEHLWFSCLDNTHPQP